MDVAPFDIAELPHAVAERSKIPGHRRLSAGMENADAMKLIRLLLRARRERPRDRSAECGQQFPPSDDNCHTPLPCEVRKRKNTTPRACCPNSAAPGAGRVHARHRNCNGAPPDPTQLPAKSAFFVIAVT